MPLPVPFQRISASLKHFVQVRQVGYCNELHCLYPPCSQGQQHLSNTFYRSGRLATATNFNAPTRSVPMDISISQTLSTGPAGWLAATNVNAPTRSVPKDISISQTLCTGPAGWLLQRTSLPLPALFPRTAASLKHFVQVRQVGYCNELQCPYPLCSQRHQHLSNTLYRSGRLASCSTLVSSDADLGGMSSERKAG